MMLTPFSDWLFIYMHLSFSLFLIIYTVSSLNPSEIVILLAPVRVVATEEAVAAIVIVIHSESSVLCSEYFDPYLYQESTSITWAYKI